MNGRQVTELFQGEVEAGMEYAPVLEADKLEKGTYIYRLFLPSGEIESGRLIKN